MGVGSALAALALLIAGCSQQVSPVPSIASLSPSAATVASFGDPTTLRWSGSNVTAYSLSVRPGTGVTVDGSAYTGPVDLGASTHASVGLPSNTTGSSVVYIFTLTATATGGVTPTTRPTTVTVEGLAATAYTNSTAGYGFDFPTGVAADASGNTWIANNGNSSVTELR